MRYSTASYLMHYGIEGQKWGVRRYQNPDGSLTAEGRIHYGLDDKSIRSYDIKNKDTKYINKGMKKGQGAARSYISDASNNTWNVYSNVSRNMALDVQRDAGKIYGKYIDENPYASNGERRKYRRALDKEQRKILGELIKSGYDTVTEYENKTYSQSDIEKGKKLLLGKMNTFNRNYPNEDALDVIGDLATYDKFYKTNPNTYKNVEKSRKNGYTEAKWNDYFNNLKKDHADDYSDYIEYTSGYKSMGYGDAEAKELAKEDIRQKYISGLEYNKKMGW